MLTASRTRKLKYYVYFSNPTFLNKYLPFIFVLATALAIVFPVCFCPLGTSVKTLPYLLCLPSHVQLKGLCGPKSKHSIVQNLL